jgi:hypothetical protein
VGEIDRRKQDIDVLERVLGSTREGEEGREGHTEVVDIGVRPWIGGTVTSATETTVGVEPEPEKPEPDR